MKSTSLLLLACCTIPAFGADLPPDMGNEVPASAQRPVVVTRDTERYALSTPEATLPAGYTLHVAAAAPLVLHPIAGCLDDRGRLFIGDAVGVNWNKAQLEKNPPNRVLMLEDTDEDGTFDKSTVFADKMTFPQGAQWLKGSLYVMSPPGMWRLTDTNDDGVADQREMIVSGFDYTGNAADVHGPFLHPNGRLYWCHGRKGYKVPDKDGNIIHEGKSSGIWSCLPDGSDVQWHSLLAGDNPVEVDFTPEGDVIGVQNLYYSQPRGDTLVHWLYGGVYERADQMKVIEGLPRTLETMPVMHNFGHVAVSGACFWKAYPTGNREPRSLHFMVTHFNTQRVVRMELTPEGSTYKATENEFLKITHTPDIHFTDVMEDPRDGSLLVLDTGGWFRIGCPSSLMAKPDVAGAVYRIQRTVEQGPLVRESRGPGDASSPSSGRTRRPLSTTMDEASLLHGTADVPRLLAALKSSDAFAQRRACEAIAQSMVSDEAIKSELLRLLGLPLDPVLEHAVMTAVARTYSVLRLGFEASETPEMLRRKAILGMQCGDCGVVTATYVEEPLAALQSDDPRRVAAAQAVFRVLPAPRTIAAQLRDLVKAAPAAAQSKLWRSIQSLEPLLNGVIETKEGSEAAALMLAHPAPLIQDLALRVLASGPTSSNDAAFLPPLAKRLQQGVSPLVLEALKKLKSPHFDTALQAIANDPTQPQSIRLKALDAMSTRKIVGETFTMVFEVLTKPESSAAAKIQAAAMLARASHAKEEQLRLATVFAIVGPIELKELLPLIRASKDEAALRAMVTELAKNPAMSSLQESLYRTALADKPTDLFEKIVLPAYQKAMETTEAKKRLLGPLSDKAVAQGDAKAGRALFAAGKGTCIACHKIGDLGRAIGPDLSKIGAIRTERDLLESILFPSNTLARDYEAHIIETSGGETITGVIRSHTAEGLLVVDVAGQERNVPHGSITGNTTLATSLMPIGLDTTLPEQELLDLVAYLRSLR